MIKETVELQIITLRKKGQCFFHHPSAASFEVKCCLLWNSK